jgi:F0F1-type ATP synthase delta subunit
MLREAYEEIDAMRARATEEIEQQRAEALRLHRSRIGELVTTLVRRMMEDILDPTIQRAYLDAFLDQLRSTRLEERLAANGRKGPLSVELITATAMAPEHETRFVAILEKMVSQPIDVTHRVDPHLVAGAMARLGDFLIDGSLQGQLEGLRSRYEAQIE